MTVPLVRARDNKVLAGICAGMAVYFDMDVTLMRVLWVLAGILLFPAVPIAYLVMVFVIPEGDPVSRKAEAATEPTESWAPVQEEE